MRYINKFGEKKETNQLKRDLNLQPVDHRNEPFGDHQLQS